MIEIIKTSKKSTKLYKYKRVYFNHKLYYIYYIYREIREDFFPKRKTIKWFEIQKSERKSKERQKTYKYEKPVEVFVSEAFSNDFQKEYELYLFKIREKKLKRLVL